jgi:hypothetical protein
MNVLMAGIAAVTGRKKRVVAAASVLFHRIARLMAGKMGVTTGKTHLTNRKTAVI